MMPKTLFRPAFSSMVTIFVCLSAQISQSQSPVDNFLSSLEPADKIECQALMRDRSPALNGTAASFRTLYTGFAFRCANLKAKNGLKAWEAKMDSKFQAGRETVLNPDQVPQWRDVDMPLEAVLALDLETTGSSLQCKPLPATALPVSPVTYNEIITSRGGEQVTYSQTDWVENSDHVVSYSELVHHNGLDARYERHLIRFANLVTTRLALPSGDFVEVKIIERDILFEQLKSAGPGQNIQADITLKAFRQGETFLTQPLKLDMRFEGCASASDSDDVLSVWTVRDPYIETNSLAKDAVGGLTPVRDRVKTIAISNTTGLIEMTWRIEDSDTEIRTLVK